MCKKIFLLTIVTLLLAFAGSVSAFDADANLLVYYEFQNDATNSGSLGTSGDGTEVNFSTDDHYPASGKFGDAFQLLDSQQNGTYDDTITVGYSSTIADKTFAFWYKRPDATAISYSYLHWGPLRLNFESNSDGSAVNCIVGNPTIYVSGNSGALATDTWHHLVATFDDNGDGSVDPTFYVNGSIVDSGDPDQPDDTGMTLRLGWGTSNAGWLIDDYRIYDYALSAADVNELYEYNPGPNASNPNPSTGATAIDANADLSWTAGLYCQDTNAHEIYLGTNYTAVSDANTTSSEFKGRQNLDSNSYDPGTLNDGTTYYWRIDEVNDSEGGSPWKGTIWNFRILGMNYYVSPSGSDSNDGSIGYPWKTFSKAKDSASPGNTIYFRAGTYFQDKVLINFPKTATAEDRISFKGYPGETAIITCMQARDNTSYWTAVPGYANVYSCDLETYQGGGEPSGSDIPNCSEDGVPMDRMVSIGYSGGPEDLTGPGQWAPNVVDYNLYVWSSDGTNPGNHYTEICQFEWGGNNLINLHQAGMNRAIDEDGFDYLTFENLTIEGAHYPIDISSDYIELKSCVFRNCYGDGIKVQGCTSNDPNNPDDPCDPNYWNSVYGLIEDCNVYAFHESGIDITGGDYWAVRDCIIHSPSQGEATAIMMKNNVKDLVVERNEIVSCGITMGGSNVANDADGVMVKNNILRGREGAGIIVYFVGAKDCSFSNNLIADCNISVEVIRFNSLNESEPNFTNRNCEIRGNIFYNNIAPAIYWESPYNCTTDLHSNYNVVDGNMTYNFGGSSYTFEEWQGLGYDANSVTDTPTFIDGANYDFHSLSTSPQLNAGDPAPPTDANDYDPYGANELDLDWNPRVNPDINIVDIGPYEFYVSSAYNPNPADEATGVYLDKVLSWSPLDSAADTNGHDVYFGTDYNEVAEANISDPNVYMGRQDSNSYDPNGGGNMDAGTTYYWAIDEVNGVTTWTGDLWNFTTIGTAVKVTTPSPADDATGIDLDADVSWAAGAEAENYNVYFSTSFSDVNTATDPDVSPGKGNQTSLSYNPGTLDYNTPYYWRIDANNVLGATTGDVWSFTAVEDYNNYLATQYKFDESSGYTAADSVNDVNMTLNGTFDDANCWVPAKFVNGIYCDGVDDWAAMPAAVGTDFHNKTISMWVKTPSTLGSGGYILNATEAYRMNIELYPSGIKGVVGAGSAWASTNMAPSTNTWYHLALVVEDSGPNVAPTFYIDGQAQSDNGYEKPQHSGTLGNWTFGSYYLRTSAYAKGTVDDFRIYDTALSASDVNDLYQAGLPSAPTVTSSAATNVDSDSARLNGEVTATGNESPTTYIYWGDDDAGTTAGNWDNEVNLGIKGAETFYKDISSLNASTTYYFRSYATNSGGNDWANSTENFTTDAVAPTSLFADSFENGEWDSKWTEDAQNDWFTSSTEQTDGTYSAAVDGDATDANISSIAIDVSSYSDANVTFDWWIDSGVDSGEYLKFDVKLDSGSWTNKASLDGDVDPENQWNSEDIYVDVNGASNMYLRFRGTMDISNEDAYVDDVNVMGTP